MAACYGHTGVVRLLLTAPGLDVNAAASITTKSIATCTAHAIARGQGFMDIAALIEDDPRFCPAPLPSTESLSRLSSPFIWEKLDVLVPTPFKFRVCVNEARLNGC